MSLNKYFVLYLSVKHFLLLAISGLFILFSFKLDNIYVGIFAIACFLSVLFYLYKKRGHLRGEFDFIFDKIQSDLGLISKNAMFFLSVPVAIYDLDGNAIWKNHFLEELFTDKNEERSYILELTKRMDPNKLSKTGFEWQEERFIREKSYGVKAKLLQKFATSEKDAMLVYFFDQTELYLAKKKNEDEKPVIAIVVIDNYDDLMKSMEDAKRPQLLAEIDQLLVKWFKTTSGVIKKYERDKYILFFEQQHLKEMEEKKFDILNSVKEIDYGNKISATVSIGIANMEDTLDARLHLALAQLEIALGRGGDQVVMKTESGIKFIGGKSKELEKRTKVKVRVIGNALMELMKQADQIVIMGHSNCDIDCLGASIGVYKLARVAGKEAHIVLGGANSIVDPFIQKLYETDAYDGVFINNNQAIDLIAKSTLLVVVDTHRPNFTEAPELLKISERVIVIDHHRRGVDFIEDTLLTYHEPYASSTCELVTEIIQYYENVLNEKKNILTPVEANMLYAGIVVDTKGFTFKTGVRTFEASAYLRDRGVDTVDVKRLLQNDLDSYRVISDIVKDVRVLNGNMAYSMCEKEVKNPSLIGAQAADQILGIMGIEASFVLMQQGSQVFVSGRSLGRVNVQVILEKVGGGGHQTVAGVQFQQHTMQESIQKILIAIEAYQNEVED